MRKTSDKYDVVIVGAGIAGLVCGNYLAKAGKKTLIIEQHSKVGGYCSSFNRGKYRFDSCIHGIGAFRKNGVMKKIYTELDLEALIKIKRINPSDIVITPDYKIKFFNSTASTIEELTRFFPQEKNNIGKFFNLLEKNNAAYLYFKLKDRTMKELLDEYFMDDKLKAILSIPMLTMWMSPIRSAAIASAISFREFIMDGGYYPEGGMQNFSDVLLKRYASYGGDILCSERVIKIDYASNKIRGIITSKNKKVQSEIVVSCADCRTTYLDMLNGRDLSKNFVTKLRELEPCDSALIVYLVLDGNIEKEVGNCSVVWYSQTYDIDDSCFRITDKGTHKCCFLSFPSLHSGEYVGKDKTCLFITIGAAYKNKMFWVKNKNILADKLLDIAEEAIPNLRKRILLKEIATPLTFEKYTLNHKGAVHGWESSVVQCNNPVISEKSPIENLYLAGHWITQRIGQGGVAMAARSGMQAARLLLSAEKMNSKKYDFGLVEQEAM